MVLSLQKTPFQATGKKPHVPTFKHILEFAISGGALDWAFLQMPLLLLLLLRFTGNSSGFQEHRFGDVQDVLRVSGCNLP